MNQQETQRSRAYTLYVETAAPPEALEAHLCGQEGTAPALPDDPDSDGYDYVVVGCASEFSGQEDSPKVADLIGILGAASHLLSQVKFSSVETEYVAAELQGALGGMLAELEGQSDV